MRGGATTTHPPSAKTSRTPRRNIHHRRRNRDEGGRRGIAGDRDRLAGDIVELIIEAEERTGGNQSLTLMIALNYGSHAEIARAARALASEACRGLIDPETIDEETFARKLHTTGIPDPDLVIRTSGEQRLSNFLLWQAAYAELVFMDTLWPDFTKDSLREAIDEFHRRERRYGATNG